jgi:organic hydroperoxide reductase OsmC/OhrA
MRWDRGRSALAKSHSYRTIVVWTGNDGVGTRDYRAYRRDYLVRTETKPDLLGSADRVFRGDARRYNPEEFLVAALSSCHMLWYLHLCAVRGVIVEDYKDEAEGVMIESADGSGRFTSAVLHPVVTISGGDPNVARELHDVAHRMCFIANSVNFPVRHEATITVAPTRLGVDGLPSGERGSTKIV